MTSKSTRACSKSKQIVHFSATPESLRLCSGMRSIRVRAVRLQWHNSWCSTDCISGRSRPVLGGYWWNAHPWLRVPGPVYAGDAQELCGKHLERNYPRVDHIAQTFAGCLHSISSRFVCTIIITVSPLPLVSSGCEKSLWLLRNYRAHRRLRSTPRTPFSALAPPPAREPSHTPSRPLSRSPSTPAALSKPGTVAAPDWSETTPATTTYFHLQH